MKSRRCLKKTVTGMSVLAMSASVIAPAAPVIAAEQQDVSVQQESSPELTYDEIKANDNVLYTVNCGTPDPSVIPNEESERMGLMQSSVDQEYGIDAQTNTIWGRDAENEYSKAASSSSDAVDIGNSFIYMSEEAQFDIYKSGLGYSFEVPSNPIEGLEDDTYEVTVAFKHYWDDRLVNVTVEDQTVATDVELKYGDWVSRTFKVKVTDGELNLQVKSPRRTSAKQDPLLNYIKIRAVDKEHKEAPNYTSFTGVAGEPMYDTNGNQIQAHGGQIQQLTVDGVTKWYWIGEDKTNDYRPVGGIHMYSSEDLYNWTDEGVVLRTMENPDQFETDEYFSSLYGDCTPEEKEEIFIDLDKNNGVMERPKMLYNEKTGKYVIWFHADGRYPGSDADYGKAKAGVAVSDSPTGPFKLLGSYKLNYHNDPNADYGYDGWDGRGSVRDMNLFKDDDGTAYVIYSSEGNKTTFISKLSDDYTQLAVDRDEAVEGVDFTRNFIGWSREAPAMFKYQDKYYIVNSGCTGWSPNPAQYAVAEHPLGPWTAMGDPCTDWESDTTYHTQSTCVFPVDAENGKYIYMGDRWNAGDLSESRYVWLPVEFQPDDKIALRRFENWDLSALDGKGLFEIKTELPKTVSSADSIMEQLPSEVTITYGTEDETTPVTWEAAEYDANKMGTVTVKGTLTEKGRTFTHDIHVINRNTLYFFDSGAQSSQYFDAVKAELGNKVKNDTADPKYTEENKAGFTGAIDTESPDSYDVGLHEGTTCLENGWWAASGKNIEYAFELQPGTYTLSAGFQEWWDTNRDMKLTIAMGDKILAEQDFALASGDKELQINQEFEVTEAGKVIAGISKRSGGEPVLSWMGVAGTENQEPEGVNRRSLELAVAMAAKLEQEQKENQCYTAASWEAVQKALDNARTLMDNADAAQEQIDSAFIDLMTACNLLENGVLKVGLKAAIEGTKAVLADEASLEQYTPESVQAVRDALAEAESVFAEDSADQETVNNASRKLMDAVTGMLVDEESSRLDILIQKAESLLRDKDKYTASSVQKLEEALAAAKAVNANTQASETEINEAYNKLAEAMTSLVRKGNKEELKNALDKANEILKDSGKYLEESIAGLETATMEAQAIYDSEDADADAVGEVLKKLIGEILKARLMGDVNLDGNVDTEDSAEVLKAAAELGELTDEQHKAADVNKDGMADSKDAASILQYAAEKITVF
ncbi:family 43 glycosylhydrolase [Blautia producta]|nr:family 43 glycosylhydrolase [Blautia producta]QIB57137.1 family 43 glycosylhydrolase [Blautia producta ATCC 27340 = DSM 2950]